MRFDSSDHPVTTDPWSPAPHARDDLARALVSGGVAGLATSHDRGNVRWKIHQLVVGDPVAQFGIRGLEGFSEADVLGLMAEAAGFDPGPLPPYSTTAVDPLRVLASLDAAGDRLALAAGRGERVILATGHPAGLPLLYMSVGVLLEHEGAKLMTPAEGVHWRDAGRHREIRYFRKVAALTDRASTLHTHAPDAMERMLEEARPDLVFADHGFAGAAIDAGIETISIADVNDPAPVVARAQGRTEIVIVMDDNVHPDAYWPCFQAIAARFGPTQEFGSSPGPR
jgi:hypothetical protein